MLSVIVHNVRSIWNVGSMFRTADAGGVDFIWLTGYTPGPDTHPEKIAKTALGAELMVPWKRVKRVGDVVRRLKKEGVDLVALEQTENSIDYRKHTPRFPMALIVGSEIGGLPRSVVRLCDTSIEIPMRGKKESLNVAVAFGIAVYELTRRRK